MHVVILGSAPLLMQSGLTESLAGRFEPVRVIHWSFNEMADAFNFDLAEYIYFGGYPGGARFIREEDRWRDYILWSTRPTEHRQGRSRHDAGRQASNAEAAIRARRRLLGQILPYNKMLESAR